MAATNPLSSDLQNRVKIALAGPAAATELVNQLVSPSLNRITLNQGTGQSTPNVTLSAGFGSTAAVAMASGSNDSRGQMSITCNGSGLAGSPTATLTFADGAYASAPFADVGLGVSQQGTGTASIPLKWSTTTGALNIVVDGTVYAATLIIINWAVQG